MHLISPKNAQYVLREHDISGAQFLEFKVATQMGVMADILSRQRVGPFTRTEFLRAAANMVLEDASRNR